MMFVACDDEVSYTEMKERETDAIKAFIRSEGINVISFDEFIKDSITDVANNEYVCIDDVYMQIVRNPKGEEGARQMYEGEKLNMMARFFEHNMRKYIRFGQPRPSSCRDEPWIIFCNIHKRLYV